MNQISNNESVIDIKIIQIYFILWLYILKIIEIEKINFMIFLSNKNEIFNFNINIYFNQIYLCIQFLLYNERSK